MSVHDLRPVQVDLSEREARAVAAGLEVAVSLTEPFLAGRDSITLLTRLQERFTNAAECARQERELGL